MKNRVLPTREHRYPNAAGLKIRSGVLPMRVLCYAVIAVMLLVYLFPLFFAMNTSLKSKKEFMRSPTTLTTSWQTKNYASAWEKAKLGQYFFNSVLYTAVSVILGIFMTLFLAFPVSRGYVKHHRFWFYLFMCGMFLPSGLIVEFRMILSMGLYNTKLGYILIMTGVNTTAFYFFNGYIKGIPRDLDDAAAIDGCGYGRYLITCVTPLMRPAMMSMLVLSALGAWNDVIKSIIYLSSSENYNIMRGLYVFTGQYSTSWPEMTAALFIVGAPVLVFYLVGQRYIVDGIMAGSVKG